MKHLILFILVTTYFRLHEACENNRVELHNELGPGRTLEFHCSSVHDLRDDLGVKNLNFNAPPFVIEFHDNVVYRTIWNCLLRQGVNKEYFYNIEAYKAPKNFIPRCGQLRVWTAKLDGIYFSKNVGIPPVLALRWNKA
ncbi:unnamed protein product [Eruca vesicaria subsp. sativa]|uniref:S-protein homolog n=1 Tax=Eruca vesicaria subsp. sativa TaxID=29727 RepID=A0ABC8MBH1_ERUVS|nr:unnamed protein product [Eruca vesicaria subsp. sativa]